MDPSSKWKLIKEYLKAREATALSQIRAAALSGEEQKLATLGTQLAVALEIIAKVESFDHEVKENLKGRVTPPIHKY